MLCPLCQKIAAPPAEELIWDFAQSRAFLGPWQYYRGYCVLVSRHHAAELFELPAAMRREFLDEMCILAEAIARTVQPRKLNYELLGNQVPHLHWHLFPRFDDDPDKLRPAWLAIETADEQRKSMLRGTHVQDTIVGIRHQLAYLTGSGA